MTAAELNMTTAYIRSQNEAFQFNISFILKVWQSLPFLASLPFKSKGYII